uniref:Uncharacterized protein n=1 Tax=Ditylenchus dipsaci TaxID=166011 RepID=A0A915D8F7_9BILA
MNSPSPSRTKVVAEARKSAPLTASEKRQVMMTPSSSVSTSSRPALIKTGSTSSEQNKPKRWIAVDTSTMANPNILSTELSARCANCMFCKSLEAKKPNSSQSPAETNNNQEEESVAVIPAVIDSPSSPAVLDAEGVVCAIDELNYYVWCHDYDSESTFPRQQFDFSPGQWISFKAKQNVDETFEYFLVNKMLLSFRLKLYLVWSLLTVLFIEQAGGREKKLLVKLRYRFYEGEIYTSVTKITVEGVERMSKLKFDVPPPDSSRQFDLELKLSDSRVLCLLASGSSLLHTTLFPYCSPSDVLMVQCSVTFPLKIDAARRQVLKSDVSGRVLWARRETNCNVGKTVDALLRYSNSGDETSSYWEIEHISPDVRLVIP